MDYRYNEETKKIEPAESETPMGRLMQHAFEQLNKEDIAWLKDNTESCLERMRILSLINDSTRMYYEVEPRIAQLEQKLKEAEKKIDRMNWGLHPDRMGR